MAVVSNSEESKFKECEFHHLFSHELRLQPRIMPDHLVRGIIVHEGLAEFYKTIQHSGWRNIRDAEQNALRVAAMKTMEYPNNLKAVQEATMLLRMYFKHYREEDSNKYRILEVEEYHEFVLNPDEPNILFGMRLDLLWEHQSGRYRGQIELVDHKCTYNFYNQTRLDLDKQLPKYMGALRRNHVNVTRAIFNQIRTRQLTSKDTAQYFKRAEVRPEPAEIEKIEEQHHRNAREILRRRTLPLATRKELANRALNEQACSRCSFTVPCKFDLKGVDMDATLKANYSASSYGYGR